MVPLDWFLLCTCVLLTSSWELCGSFQWKRDSSNRGTMKNRTWMSKVYRWGSILNFCQIWVTSCYYKWAPKLWICENILGLTNLPISTKAWVIGNHLIFDRDLFSAIEIAIGDRHLVKRSQNDRDHEIQQSNSIFLAFFSGIYLWNLSKLCKICKKLWFE